MAADRVGSIPLLEVKNVSKKYCRSLRRSLIYGCYDILDAVRYKNANREYLRKDEFWSLSDINFTVQRGEVLAVLGRNGAGKTSLLKLINGLLNPDKGEITVRGSVGALIALGAGFNPVLSGRENVYVNAAILGFTKKETDANYDEIVSFSELEEFMNSPVKNYSSGMRMRLGFAIASQIKPDILLLDEVFSVGDISFRRKCIKKLEEIKKDVAVLFVSHNLRLAEELCDQAIYLEKGRIKYAGDVDYVNGKYLEDINHDNRFSDVALNREGTGEIRFTGIVAHGAISGSNRLTLTGEDLIIEAGYEVFKEMENIKFRVGIEDTRSGVVITMANVHAKHVGKAGKVVCTFNNICLRPGVYSINLGVTDGRFGLDIWRFAAEVVVSGARNEDVQFSIADSDLVYLPHQIQVVE